MKKHLLKIFMILPITLVVYNVLVFELKIIKTSFMFDKVFEYVALLIFEVCFILSFFIEELEKKRKFIIILLLAGILIYKRLFIDMIFLLLALIEIVFLGIVG